MSLIFPLRKRGIKRTKTGFAFARFPASSTQSIEGKRGVLEFAAVEVNVNRLRILSLIALASASAGVFGTEAQHVRPSIVFGGATISLGMTSEQVERSLADADRHIRFLKGDKHTALVLLSNSTEPEGVEGQVTFFNGRLVYAAFDFPVASDAHELAQQIAGAVESMDSKECRVSNFSGHGTGGGYSETRFDCGAKGFEVMSVEPMGTKERYTPELKMTIGEMPRAN
jgi:hypothetical protein